MEIGSEFWNYQVSKTQMQINCVGDRRDFISGRSALAYIINDIKFDRKITSVYMPAYCCESVVNVFNYNNIKIFFYDIEFKNDKIEYILDDKIDCDLILVMNYFGFNHSDYDKFFDLYHDKIIIEDITHSLFGSKKNDLVNYSFASIRKWDAIPFGGIAIKKNGKFHINQSFLNNKFIQKRKEAMNIKKLYIENKIGNKQQYLQLFREAENILENDYYIDTVANEYYYIDEASLISKRQQNAKYLIKNLKDIINIEIPFFVQRGDCPLFVPILIKNNQRNDLQKYLINEDIYLPIHWPLIDGISNKYKCIEYFSNELSVVCDQRYGLDDMQKIVNKIRGFMNK